LRDGNAVTEPDTPPAIAVPQLSNSVSKQDEAPAANNSHISELQARPVTAQDKAPAYDLISQVSLAGLHLPSTLAAAAADHGIMA
jgi:hypothetical protein